MTHFLLHVNLCWKYLFLLISFTLSLRISSKKRPSAIKPFTDSTGYYLVSLVTDYVFNEFVVLKRGIVLYLIVNDEGTPEIYYSK